MAGRLQGKTVLVTAAAQGMGRAASVAFEREGAHVIATDLKAELLANLPPAITKKQLDVLDDAAGNAFVEDTGAVEVLFNCAGYVHQGSILDCTIKDWDFSFDLNVRSMFVMTKAMLPKMIAAGGGTILNMASVLGAHKAAPNRLAYAASKAAVRNHTKSVALFCAENDYRIRCNSIHPAAIMTPMWDAMLGTGEQREMMIKSVEDGIPMGHFGESLDVAYGALYLASDEAKYVTGIELTIDGGILAGSQGRP